MAILYSNINCIICLLWIGIIRSHNQCLTGIIGITCHFWRKSFIEGGKATLHFLPLFIFPLITLPFFPPFSIQHHFLVFSHFPQPSWIPHFFLFFVFLHQFFPQLIRYSTAQLIIFLPIHEKICRRFLWSSCLLLWTPHKFAACICSFSADRCFHDNLGKLTPRSIDLSDTVCKGFCV